MLEGLCGHAVSFGAGAIEVKRQDGCERVCACKGGTVISIARYPLSGKDARELRQNLHAAVKKRLPVVLGGRRFRLIVRVSESSGEDMFRVEMEPALGPDGPFTAKQGQYLAYIYAYTKIHRQAPAETDLERYFRVSAPSVHEMLKTLQRNGFIERTPRQARSIRLLVPPEHLPPLE